MSQFRKIANRVHTLLITFLLFGCSQASAAPGRTATIQWRPVENAVKYEFELSKVPEMDPKILSESYTTTAKKLTLQPGTYYFRVRGVDAKDAPGPWTEVQGFTVNPSAPRILAPADRSLIKDELEGGMLALTWTDGIPGTLTQIEITDIQGATSVWKTARTEHLWKPPGPGIYRWRVGYESASGTEWGTPAKFKIEASALPAPPVQKVIEYVKEKAENSPNTASSWEADPNSVRSSEWSAIGRGAQAIVAYSGVDIDSGINASGAAVVSLLSAELRWRGPKSRTQRWTWSAALNFELIRQTVLGTTFSLPRVYGRAYLGREYGRWRVGGFTHASYGKAGIFVVEGATEATKTTVARPGFGLGAMATYRASETLFLSLIAMTRLDVGGSSDDLPNPLVTSLGFEAGFGLALGLTDTLFLEGRLRVLNEDYSWNPAVGGDSLSSLTNTFLILDVGLGLKF